MKDLIASMVTPDQMLEIAFIPSNGIVNIFRGQLAATSSDALAVTTPEGYTRLLPLSSVCYIDILKEKYVSEPETSPNSVSEPVAEPDRSDVYSNTPILNAPKVVGRIELGSMGSTSRFRRQSFDSIDEPEEQAQEEMLPAMGHVVRMGANFGFIQPVDSDATLYVSRGELLNIHGLIKAPDTGDAVIYTPSVNRQGNAAKCVHRVCSLHTLEDMAERLAGYDPRNASILRSRLRAVQEGLPLDQVSIEPRPRRERPAPQVIVDPHSVLDMVENGEDVSPRSLTECEEVLSGELNFDDYILALLKLLDYSMSRELSATHRLLSRGIRLARENDDTDTALRLARAAVDHYRNHPGNYKFFKAIEHRLMQPEPAVFAVSDQPSPTAAPISEIVTGDIEALRDGGLAEESAPRPADTPEEGTMASDDSQPDENDGLITI